MKKQMITLFATVAFSFLFLAGAAHAGKLNCIVSGSGNTSKKIKIVNNSGTRVAWALTVKASENTKGKLDAGKVAHAAVKKVRVLYSLNVVYIGKVGACIKLVKSGQTVTLTR